MATPDYFDRVAGSVNFSLLQTKLVTVVGVGMVGSQIARELAKCGVGRLRLIDHDVLERANLARHALDDRFLGWNKAEGMTIYLAEQIAGIKTEALPRKIDGSVSEELLDRWLADADVVVAATDDHNTQRRIGRRTLLHGLPSIFPALFVEGGGEAVVQFDDQLPCFSCWDEFRPTTAPLRGAQAANYLALPVIFTSLRLCLGLLDPAAPDREMMRAVWPPYQVFGLNRFGTLHSARLEWRETCPSCLGRPPGAAEHRLSPPQPASQQQPQLPTIRLPNPAQTSLPRSQPRHEATTGQLTTKHRALLLPLLGLVASIGILAIVASTPHINNPSFGQALIGFACVVGFWVSVAKTLKAIVALFRR